MSLAYNTGYTGTGTTSCTVTMGSIPYGQGVWALVVADAGTIVAPSGWTARGTSTTGSGFPVALFSRVSDPSMGADHVFSGGTTLTEAVILVVSNNSTTENDATPTFGNGLVATVTWPNITSVTANTLHLIFVADSPGATTLPGGAYTARQASGTYIKTASAPIAAAGLVTGVTGGGGADWCAISVLVRPAGPTITSQPSSATKNVGETATFNISATANDGALSYQWKVNGSNVGTNSNSYTTGTLTNSNQWDAITCVVTDADGSTTSSTAVLTIAFAAAGTGPRRRNIIGAHPVGSLGWLGIASGSGTTNAAAYSAGLATGIAVGQSSVAADALSSAIATALAVGAAITRADAFTQGASTALAVGATLQSGDAFTQGTSTAQAVGSSSATTQAVAFSAGVATDIATGQSTNATDAFTQGAATDIAAGQSTVASDAFTQGTSTALAVGTTSGGATVISGDGYSAGVATDQATGALVVAAAGASAGASTAKAVGSGGASQGNTVITLGANPWRAKGNMAQVDQENEEIMQLLAQLVPLLSQGGTHHASR